MASPIIFVLALLGGCVFAQETQQDNDFGDLLPKPFFDDQSKAVTPYASVAECAQTLVAGYYLAKAGWDLRNEWISIPQQREEGLKNCTIIEDATEKEKCIENVEQWTQGAKNKVYQKGVGLAIGTGIILFKVKGACLV